MPVTLHVRIQTAATYVYFGADDGGLIQWRVLDVEDANDDETDGIFLRPENMLTQVPFNYKTATIFASDGLTILCSLMYNR